MCPALTRNDGGDGWLADTVFRCELALSNAFRALHANGAYFVVGKFVVVVSLMTKFVSKVFGLRAPIEIAQGIVGCVAVAVTRFASWRARAYKRFEYNVMNISSATATHADNLACVSGGHLIEVGCKDSPGVSKPPSVVAATPNRTIVAHTIARSIFDSAVCDHASVISQHTNNCKVAA